MTPDQAQPVLDDAEASLEAGDADRARILFGSIAGAEGPSAHQQAQAEAGLGECELRDRRPREAEARFLKASRLDPAPWYRYRLGEARMRLGDWGEAAESFREALAAFPESETHARAEVLGRLGRARFLAGDREGGMTDLLRAAAEDPVHAPLHADLGDCRLVLRDWPGAAAAYGRALELDPGNPDYASARDRALRIQSRS